MTQVNMLQAKTELSKLIASLEKKEQEKILIARDGKPVAVLMLYDPPKKQRKLGMFSGKYSLPEDMDEGNDEVLSLMLGEEEK